MTAAIQMIEANIFTTEARGVSYHLRLNTFGRWELSSQRQALRAARMGGSVRHFDSLEAVSNNVRAFRGIHLLAA